MSPNVSKEHEADCEAELLTVYECEVPYLLLVIQCIIKLLNLIHAKVVLFFSNFKIFIYLFLAVLGLRCCTQAFSSCVRVTLHCGAWASHCGGFSCRAWALGALASVVVVHGLSCSAAGGIFPDQGSNLCPLHWQVDS